MSRELFERLRKRAVEIHVEEHLRSRLERGESLRVKLGLDPTAPDLHVGDPSGRSETRPILTREQVDAAARTYLEQIHLVLDRKRLEVRRNSEWLGEMKGADVLRLLGKATLQQILQREDFSDRVKAGTPIGAHEILYPFNQAYDSVAINADVEIGGTDQLFNLLFGREIQKAYGQEPQDIAVFPLLEGTDGSMKMSKSLGNYIGLAEPPEEIYGKTMSIPDRLTEKYLRLVSGLPSAEVENVRAMKPRDAKAALARQLVKRLHGEEAAALAEADFDRKFRQHEMPESMPERRVSKPQDMVETLVEVEFAKSRAEARRLIDQGGVRINGDKASADAELHDGDVLQVGKRSFVRIRLG